MLLLQKTSFDFIPFLYFVIIFQRHASLPGITENTIPSFISHLPSSEKAFSHEDSGAVPLKLLCITSTAPGHIESSCAPSPSVTHLAPFSNQSFPARATIARVRQASARFPPLYSPWPCSPKARWRRIARELA